MKSTVTWTAAFFALVVVNSMIVGKERTIAEGQCVLLKLAPVDPRSLMQGDYMILRYLIARSPRPEDLEASGKIVLQLDENNVGNFVRIDDGSPLGKNEILLGYRKRKGMRIGAEAYFFEEGTGSTYQNADYGELKVTENGDSVLIGLRDKDRIPL